MTAAAIEQPAKCPFCDKEGLPILPVRYAIGRSGNNARGKPYTPVPPALDPQFGDKVTNIPLPEGEARYTLRLLREGYLYVFNEKRGTWSAYVVADGGYLYEFDFNDPAPPLPEDIAFSCSNRQDAAIARCITVKDAHVAGPVWIGFSDVLWTDEVKTRHRQQSWREKHMRRIDIDRWRTGATLPHVAPLADAARLVAEFGAEGPRATPAPTQDATPSDPDVVTLDTIVITAYPAFQFSPHRFTGCKEQQEDLFKWAEGAAKPWKPALAALWDPVGIASELDPLMHERYEDFLYEDPDRARKLAVSSAILSIRESIGNHAELEVMRAAQESAENIEIYGTADPHASANPMMDASTMAAGKALAEWLGGDKAREQYRSLAETYREGPPSQLRRARSESWVKYETRMLTGSRRYDEAARDAFQKAFDRALDTFNKATIYPLATAHRDWMRSESMANVFASNYDETNMPSGEAYTGAVMLCIGNTQDKPVCFELYKEWLEGTPDDQKNLLMRALAFNQQAVLQEAAKAKASGLDPWSLSWPSLIKVYDFSFQRVSNPESAACLIANFMMGINGPLAAVLGKITVDGPVKGIAILLGMISRQAMVPVRVEDKPRVFRRELIRKIRKLSAEAGHDVPSRRALFDPVELELRRLEVHGIQMEGSTGKTFLVLVDPAHLSNMPAGLTKAQRSAWLARSIRLPNDMALMRLPGAWQSVVNTDVRVGAVASVLDIVLLIKLWSDTGDTMDHKAADTWGRVLGGVVGVAGGIIELMAKYAKARVTFGLRFGRALDASLAKMLENVGRRATAVGGVIVAVLDLNQARLEFSEGNMVVGGLYVLSAAAGLLMVWAVYTAATGWGILLAVAMFVIAGLIAWLADDKIQDWLERCYWGSLADERYADTESEMEQLKLATKD
ncbi:T6SS effector BTH_I2691 family protein [Cupriavidus sp. AU9028]|uniref:T6SS effector BTH_I2691 family protein n=1 Tax=Cupriavidus sp. AU9028 TaxID=2871157 RepID=UPI001C98ACFA|nr:T6SS effector BTH_I2691 family protein [Cupriavidus sp. AU9028]MBY4897509.1 hypothetical protein [Cupriavidus sp. AU9028]